LAKCVAIATIAIAAIATNAVTSNVSPSPPLLFRR
jgi:hypothetical protein